jgi:hypothetical protein
MNNALGLSKWPAACSPANGEVRPFVPGPLLNLGIPRPELVFPINTEARLPSDWRIKSNLRWRAVRFVSGTKGGGERWK